MADDKDIHRFRGKYYTIDFQNGPVGEVGVNGCQNEDILEILIDRLGGLQEKLPCRENEEVLRGLLVARVELRKRSERREAQGVEGTKKVHWSLEEAEAAHQSDPGEDRARGPEKPS